MGIKALDIFSLTHPVSSHFSLGAGSLDVVRLILVMPAGD